MPTLVLASKNRHKLVELSEMLRGVSVAVRPATEYPGFPDVVEDGATFAANAVKKALAGARFTKEWALADDSGLEVDALGGQPGVFSARFAGEPSSDSRNNAKLLAAMNGVAPRDRSARFRSVIALVSPDGNVECVEGTCEGIIGYRLSGEGGFGYDPLFIVPSLGKTFAELTPDEKNRISHRGRAMQALRTRLLTLFDATAD